MKMKTTRRSASLHKGMPERNIGTFVSFSKINCIRNKINYKLRPILSVNLIMALILLLAAP